MSASAFASAQQPSHPQVYRAEAPLGAKAGGACRDRTDDLKLAKLALSQLSYKPNACSLEADRGDEAGYPEEERETKTAKSRKVPVVRPAYILKMFDRSGQVRT